MNISSISDSTIMEEYVKRFTIKAGKGIKTSREAADHFRAYFADAAKREQFVVCFLNGQHRVLATETLFTGSITTSAVLLNHIPSQVGSDLNKSFQNVLAIHQTRLEVCTYIIFQNDQILPYPSL